MNDKLNSILFLIDQYYNGIADIASLEHNISLHFNDFDAVEERETYNEILKLEANIDSIRFTVSKDKQLEAVKKYVNDFKSRVR
jgi:hypothetical protein